MSQEVARLKQELFREALAAGWYTPGLVQGSLCDMISPERIQRWYARLYEPPTDARVPSARFINHFQIGADPEFMFMTTDGSRMDARLLNMKAGLAFGADNNGRLVELRPEPSRSCLSVLASTWLTLRWMARFTPKTLQFGWRSGAYCEQDGLGGHIHYGRKREHLRQREVASLDRITHLLFTAGIFDREEGRLRFRQGQGGHYGGLGDIRKQPHGYEYRSLPSWMDSPWLAYFNLVVGKLVVALPELLAPLTQADHSLTAEQARGQLKLLLAHLRPLDDDARLAYAILSRQGFPAHCNGADIKPAWGLFVNGPFGNAKDGADLPEVWPRTIPSYSEAEAELCEAMFEGRAPQLGELKATWSPTKLPQGFMQCIHDIDTRLAPGLGEFASDLCVHAEAHLSFRQVDGEPQLWLGPQYKEAIKKSGLAEKYDITFNSDYARRIGLRTGHTNLADLLKMKVDLLATGILPLFKIADVTAESYKEWALRQKTPAQSVKSRPIFSSQAQASANF